MSGLIKYGFITSHKGGQHTNGPDYGTVTAEHELAGVKIELQTHSRFRSHAAREVAATLIEMAIGEMRR